MLNVRPHATSAATGASFRRVLCSTDVRSRDHRICDWAAELAETEATSALTQFFRNLVSYNQLLSHPSALLSAR